MGGGFDTLNKKTSYPKIIYYVEIYIIKSNKKNNLVLYSVMRFVKFEFICTQSWANQSIFKIENNLLPEILDF